MRAFLKWFKAFLGGRIVKQDQLDESVFNTFTQGSGPNVLAYLIEEHVINMSYVPEEAQISLGKHLVVQDILARMDRHQNLHKYKIESEDDSQTIP